MNSELLLLQPIQSELFHNCKQHAHEKVDEYAQDLSRLYIKEYPQALQGTGAMETMGQTVLLYEICCWIIARDMGKDSCVQWCI